MSGGPPHHPHGRQMPSSNAAWNPGLQVPSYFPGRHQPQHAHMSNEHSLLHQSTWHTPTTEGMKQPPVSTHTHLFGLEQMLSNDCFPRHIPGVDLSLTRNGSQNGDLPTTPISLSVRDTNKINSLPPSALEIQAVELTKCTSPSTKIASPGLKSTSPSIISSLSPGLKSSSPGLKSASTTVTVDSSKTQKKAIRVDSILERLNPTSDKLLTTPTIIAEKSQEQTGDKSSTEKSSSIERVTTVIEKPLTPQSQSVIVQATTTTHDENSNSSGILNITSTREDDTVSSYSNEDSLDSNKSRRKRKPSKTMRVSKEEEKLFDEESRSSKTTEDIKDTAVKAEFNLEDPLKIVSEILEENKIPERRRSSDDLETIIPAKTRRKTSSESETIDNIAAMVQEGLKKKSQASSKETVVVPIAEEPKATNPTEESSSAKSVSVSVIKSKDNLQEALESSSIEVDPLSIDVTDSPIPQAQRKERNTHFVEVENKLEEMFAGIEDSSDPLKTDTLDLGDDSKLDDSLLKLEEDPIAAPSEEKVTEVIVVEADEEPSTSTDVKKKSPSPKKNKRKTPSNSRRNSDAASIDSTPKKKKPNKKSKIENKSEKLNKSKTKKSLNSKQSITSKIEAIKDVYAYDSGSNASSTKSKGPFIHIRGPRDSPISVNVVNAPTNEDDPEKKPSKTKKFHDDSDYRHKVRSKGLHSSTLSNKYDAQTKDMSWICAFCKRGPHSSELTGPCNGGGVIAPGDLFGPYFITTECSEYDQHLSDPFDRQFKSKKITKILDQETHTPTKIAGKKFKRKHSDSRISADGDHTDVYLGITDTGNKTFEVWAHEDCIVWSPGIYLVGPKIVGLEEAVWTSCNLTCSRCNLKGANICCLKRGCLNTMHLCCSRASNWQFDESNFKAYCPQHMVP